MHPVGKFHGQQRRRRCHFKWWQQHPGIDTLHLVRKYGGIGGGGAIYNWSFGTLTLTNSIIAGNTATTGADIHRDGGTIIATGTNLIGNNDTVSSVFVAGTPGTNGHYVGTSDAPLNPGLAPLGENGGPTRTMALLPGSPARNNASVLSPAITTDQRNRRIVYKPDIGALENQFGVIDKPLLIPLSASSANVLCSLEMDGEVTAKSDNPAIVQDASIAITGIDLLRTVTINLTGQIGSTNVTLTHVASGATDTFKVYVLPEGYIAASVSEIPDQVIDEDAIAVAIPLTVTDPASAFGLRISVTSSNSTLVPQANIVPSGDGANRILIVTPASDQNGQTTITVNVSDGATTATDTIPAHCKTRK